MRPFQQPAAATRPRAAFTLMEIMIAVSVMVVGLAGVLGTILTLHGQRTATDELRKAREIADLVHQSIQGMSWEDLNDTSKPQAAIAWARPYRYPVVESSVVKRYLGDGSDGGRRLYMTDDGSGAASQGAADVTAWYGLYGIPSATGVAGEAGRIRIGTEPQSIADHPGDPKQWTGRYLTATGLTGLQVYVEYYRATTARDENGTVLQATDPGCTPRPCLGGVFCPAVRKDTDGDGTPDSPEVWTDEVHIDSDGDGDIDGSDLWMPNDAARAAGAISGISPTVTDIDTPFGTTKVSPPMLPIDQTIAGQVNVRLGANDPVGVRVIVSWMANTGKGPRMYLSQLSGRKR